MSDQDLWQKIIKGITPIHVAKAKKKLEKNTVTAPQKKEKILKGVLKPKEVLSKFFTSHMLDRSTEQKIRKGKYPIDGRIDLHGLTQDEAYESLSKFIGSAWQEKKRCLLIITGKGSVSSGGGVLRQKLPLWLEGPIFKSKIIFSCPSHIKHGGLGAVYIFLKRQKKDGY